MNARPLRSTLLLLGLQVGLLPHAASAQDASAAALDYARFAQRRFEIERTRLLPASGSWDPGRCDELLGRMCLRHDEGGDWYPGSEHPLIQAAREELLDVLDGAAT